MESKTPAKTPEKKSLASRFKANKKMIQIIGGIVAVVVIALGGLYVYTVNGRIYTEKAEIVSPLVALSPEKPDVLQDLLVKPGDTVQAYQEVARLQNDTVRAKTDGLVVSTSNEVGKLFNPGMPVVTMINPADMRVVAHVAEDKGFSDLRVGQRVIFTVDAYGSKQYEGTVDEIAKTSDQSAIVFSISDKRAEKEFSVKIKFDVAAYPELINGMSAKAWIYKN